jgi:hypothetical protein
MAAKVVVVQGAQPGQEFWIEEEVLRIGSEAPCEIRLAEPGLAGHAATLEFRGDGYAVYNRSERPIHVDARPVAARAQAKWLANKDMFLTDQLALRLIIEGDPAPAKRAANVPAGAVLQMPTEDERPVAAAPTAEEAAKKAKSTMQLAMVLGLVVVAAAVLLLDPPKSTDNPQRNPSAEFRELITKLLADKSGDAGENDFLRNTLQSARLADLRGNKVLARDQYSRLHDWLQKQNNESKLSKDREEIWRFVKAELQQLKPPSGTFD